MSSTTFYYIINKIIAQIEKKVVTEVPIFPDFRLVVIIYKLSRSDYFYTIQEMCSQAKATVCTIVSGTLTVTRNILYDDTVKSHFRTSEDDIWQCMRKFGKTSQFLYAFSAVDGSASKMS